MLHCFQSYIESQAASRSDAGSDVSEITPRSFRGGKVPAHSARGFEGRPFIILDINIRKGEKYCKVQAEDQLYWMKMSIVEERYLEKLLRFYEKRI